MFCNVSKTLDRVWHKGLLNKFKNICLHGNILGWLENYIANRKHAVVLGCYSSRTENSNTGVQVPKK